MAVWSFYFVRTRQNCLYAGITTDVSKRFSEHQSGKKGAKYLRAKGPLQLVYSVDIGSRSLASKVEYRVKRLTKIKKEQIVVEALSAKTLLALLKLESFAEED
ncbi:MAG: GIY-YIG nuclease family protein [Cyanobacteria bacterium J06560_2]